MAPPLHVREYRPADEDRLWDLHVAASTDVDAFADPDGCESGVATDPERHAADSDRLASEGVFLVGEVPEPPDGRHLVAMGALDPVDETTVELTRMRVAPDHWRQGYGQRMLDALEARATARGTATIELETLARQTAARALYEANGYEEVGRARAGEYEVLTYRKHL